MEKNNTWLGLPGGETLEAGEDSTHGDPGGSIRSNRVSPEYPEPRVQERFKGRHERPQEAGVSVRVIPEEMVGRPIWEVFEDPDGRILSRDPETGLGSLRDGFQVVELVEEAEERAERWLKAQRHILSAFYARRKNPLYRQAATRAVARPDQPEPRLLLLWNLIGDRSLDADVETVQEVNRWLDKLSEEDFLFFTQDPEGDPQQVINCGVLPGDLRPMPLFRGYRQRLLRAIVRESAFFHPDKRVFEERLGEKLPQVAKAWDLDKEGLMSLAREERTRYHRLHLDICRASACFARSKPAPVSVPEEVVVTVAAVAYSRMDHQDYKARALAFGQIQADRAREIFARLGRFMEDFYASRLFSFLKRAMFRRLKKKAGIAPIVETFVKTFRTGIRPRGLDRALGKQVAALALFESYFGGFHGNGVSYGRPNTRYRVQILTWGGFENLAEAKQVYQAIPDRAVLRQVLFPAIAKMAKGVEKT